MQSELSSVGRAIDCSGYTRSIGPLFDSESSEFLVNGVFLLLISLLKRQKKQYKENFILYSKKDKVHSSLVSVAENSVKNTSVLV